MIFKTAHHGRAYGKCSCGNWTSILASEKWRLTKQAEHCWTCGQEIKVWYTIEDDRVWYKPWTWLDKYVVCQSYNNGWHSQSLPRELWT